MSPYLINVNNRHWYSIRKIQNQWFNLDSKQYQQIPLSLEDLQALMIQHQQQNDSIYILQGGLYHIVDESVLENIIQCFNNTVPPQAIPSSNEDHQETLQPANFSYD